MSGKRVEQGHAHVLARIGRGPSTSNAWSNQNKDSCSMPARPIIALRPEPRLRALPVGRNTSAHSCQAISSAPWRLDLARGLEAACQTHE